MANNNGNEIKKLKTLVKRMQERAKLQKQLADARTSLRKSRAGSTVLRRVAAETGKVAAGASKAIGRKAGRVALRVGGHFLDRLEVAGARQLGVRGRVRAPAQRRKTVKRKKKAKKRRKRR